MFLRLREGGRKQKQENRGGPGAQGLQTASRRGPKGPGPPDTPAERFKRPQVLHFGHLEVLPELESTPLFCSVTLQQPVLFAGPHCNMVVRSEKSRGVDFSPVAAHIRSSI